MSGLKSTNSSNSISAEEPGRKMFVRNGQPKWKRDAFSCLFGCCICHAAKRKMQNESCHNKIHTYTEEQEGVVGELLLLLLQLLLLAGNSSDNKRTKGNASKIAF